MKENLGKYKLERYLASGGMADVFLAKRCDVGPDAPLLCVKRIKPEYGGDSEFYSMFKQEARIAMALEHPNVVRVYDFDRCEKQPFIAMEYVEGLDLKQVLKETAALNLRLPHSFAFYVIQGLLRALDAASEVHVNGRVQPVVHRDVSPHNILLSLEGDVKLTDFGIAKTKGGSTVTRTGVIKGKLAYLSPEQAMSKEITPSSDLYSAGLVLYELLSGMRMNRGKAEHEVLASVLNSSFEKVSWLSEEINAFMSSLLAPTPEKRFSSAAHALEAFEQLNVVACSRREAGTLVSQISRLRSQVESDGASYLGTPERDDAFGVAQTVGVGETVGNTIPTPVAKRESRLVVGRRLVIAVAAVVVIGGGAWTLSGMEDAGQGAGTVSDDRVQAAEENSVRGDAAGEGDGRALVVNLPPAESSVSASIKTNQQREDTRTPPSNAVLKNDIKEPVPEASVSNETSVSTKSEKGRENNGYGTLTVFCRPWAEVLVDGNRAGTTPVRDLSVSAGKHQVVLVNKEQNYRKSFRVNVRRNRNETVKGRIDVPVPKSVVK